MMKRLEITLLLLLLPVVCFGQFNWLKPETVEGALSLRTPKDAGKSFDYELSTGGTWSGIKAEFLYERENGGHYIGYQVNGERQVYGLTAEANTTYHEAADIDRQTVSGLKKWKYAGVGFGLVTSHYQNLHSTATFRLPLYYGEIRYVTNFHREVQIWNVSLRYPKKDAKPVWDVQPFIRGNYMSDGDREFYKLKFGLEVKLQ